LTQEQALLLTTPGSLDPTLNNTCTALFMQPPIKKGASRRFVTGAQLLARSKNGPKRLSKQAVQSLNWRQFLSGEHVKMGKESILDRVVKLAVMQARSEN
jgi:hypothetical protein